MTTRSFGRLWTEVTTDTPDRERVTFFDDITDDEPTDELAQRRRGRRPGRPEEQ